MSRGRPATVVVSLVLGALALACGSLLDLGDDPPAAPPPVDDGGPDGSPSGLDAAGADGAVGAPDGGGGDSGPTCGALVEDFEGVMWFPTRWGGSTFAGSGTFAIQPGGVGQAIRFIVGQIPGQVFLHAEPRCPDVRRRTITFSLQVTTGATVAATILRVRLGDLATGPLLALAVAGTDLVIGEDGRSSVTLDTVLSSGPAAVTITIDASGTAELRAGAATSAVEISRDLPVAALDLGIVSPPGGQAFEIVVDDFAFR